MIFSIFGLFFKSIFLLFFRPNNKVGDCLEAPLLNLYCQQSGRVFYKIMEQPKPKCTEAQKIEITLQNRSGYRASNDNVTAFASNDALLDLADKQFALNAAAAQENLLNVAPDLETLTDTAGQDLGLAIRENNSLMNIAQSNVQGPNAKYYDPSMAPNTLYLPEDHPISKRLQTAVFEPYLGIQMYHVHPKRKTLVADCFGKLLSLSPMAPPKSSSGTSSAGGFEGNGVKFLAQFLTCSRGTGGKFTWENGAGQVRCNLLPLPKETDAVKKMESVQVGMGGREADTSAVDRSARQVFFTLHPMPFPILRVVISVPRRVGLFYAVILKSGSGIVQPTISQTFLQRGSRTMVGLGNFPNLQQVLAQHVAVTLPPILQAVETFSPAPGGAEFNEPKLPSGGIRDYLMQNFYPEQKITTLSGLIDPGAQVGQDRLHYAYGKCFPVLDSQPVDLMLVSQGLLAGVPTRGLINMLSTRKSLDDMPLYLPLEKIVGAEIITQQQRSDIFDLSIVLAIGATDKVTGTIRHSARDSLYTYNATAWPALVNMDANASVTTISRSNPPKFPVNYLPSLRAECPRVTTAPPTNIPGTNVPKPIVSNLLYIVQRLSEANDAMKEAVVTAWGNEPNLNPLDADRLYELLAHSPASLQFKRLNALGAMLQGLSYLSLRKVPLALNGPSSTLTYAILAYSRDHDYLYLFLLIAWYMGERDFHAMVNQWPSLMWGSIFPFFQEYMNCLRQRMSQVQLEDSPRTMETTTSAPSAAQAPVPTSADEVQTEFVTYRGRIHTKEYVDSIKRKRAQATLDTSPRQSKKSKTMTIPADKTPAPTPTTSSSQSVAPPAPSQFQRVLQQWRTKQQGKEKGREKGKEKGKERAQEDLLPPFSEELEQAEKKREAVPTPSPASAAPPSMLPGGAPKISKGSPTATPGRNYFYPVPLPSNRKWPLI